VQITIHGDTLTIRGEMKAEQEKKGWLHRFVRDVVTADPVTHEPLSNIQVFLIESALECVDWEALAHHPRLRHLDWEHARLTQP
jgi:hypothetical protein